MPTFKRLRNFITTLKGAWFFSGVLTDIEDEETKPKEKHEDRTI